MQLPVILDRESGRLLEGDRIPVREFFGLGEISGNLTDFSGITLLFTLVTARLSGISSGFLFSKNPSISFTPSLMIFSFGFGPFLPASSPLV